MPRFLLRRWLHRHKIYFDVLGPVFVGIAALAVSIASYFVSRTQLAVQIDQQKPHFYIGEHNKNSKGMTADIQLLNDGGTFDSMTITSMPFVFGVVTGAQGAINVPLYTHQTVVRSGQKKDLVAIIKSDVPNKFMTELQKSREGFVALDENPRMLILVRWKSQNGSGMQFFADGEPISEEAAEPCFAFWYSQSEDSLSNYELTIPKFLEYFEQLKKKPNLTVKRDRPEAACPLPQR